MVKFGDGSRVAIRGRGTIIFRCQNGEHRTLTDVYYILQLHSNIISIGQLDEHGSEVLIKDGILRIRDQEQRLLAKVKRSWNWLYLLNLKVEQPISWLHGAWRNRGYGMPDMDISASMLLVG